MLVKKGSDKIDEMKLEFRKTLIEAKKDIATKLGLEANKFHITQIDEKMVQEGDFSDPSKKLSEYYKNWAAFVVFYV